MIVPVLDIGSVSVEKATSQLSEDALRQIGKDMVQSFTEIGFLQVTNHGIPREVIDIALNVGKTFFDLPQSKKELSLRKGMEVLGYLPMPEITKQLDGVVTENFTNGLPPDPKETLQYAECIDDQRHPERQVKGFSEAINHLLSWQHTLHRRILLLLGYGLGLPEPAALWEGIRDLGNPTNESVIRFVNYPPVPNIEPGHLRCGVHTDFGTLTFVFQNAVPGLEVCDRAGNYQAVLPTEGAILVNVGDILQIWTGGVLRSAQHRVVADKESKERQRLSVIYFGITDADYPVQALIGEKSGHYGSVVTAKSFLKQRYVDIYSKGKGLIDEEK